MRRGFAAALALVATFGANARATPADDCLAEVKSVLQARLSALPLREVIDSSKDGETSHVELELESLTRFHSLISGPPAVELLILEGKGWSREHGRWLPFAAATATAESTIADEQALADQLTEGATAQCLGQVTHDGAEVVGYTLHLDGDQSSGNPYTDLKLYADQRTHLPLAFETTGLGDTGPATGSETFAYPRPLKLAPPR